MFIRKITTSLVLIQLVLFISFVYAQENKKNDFSSDWGKFVTKLQISNLSDRNKMRAITDKKAREAIKKAAKGSCPAVSQVENSSVKVENAKQCGRSAKEKKEKTGKKCTATGLQGGKIEAVCVRGCCVALSVHYDNQNKNNFSADQNGQNGQYGQSGQTGGFMQNMMQMLQGMMQGGGGGGGYQPDYNYGGEILPGYDPVADINNDIKTDDVTIDNQDVTQEESYTDTQESDEDVVTPNNMSGMTAENDIQTIITRSGREVEIKIDNNTANNRYAFVESEKPQIQELPTVYTQENDRQENIEQLESGIPVRKRTKQNSELSHTGFKSEQTARKVQPSFWSRISAWLVAFLGLN